MATVVTVATIAAVRAATANEGGVLLSSEWQGIMNVAGHDRVPDRVWMDG